MTWQAGISQRHAREVVRLAEARQSHPNVMDAFAEGAPSQDQAAIATKAPAYARPTPKPDPGDEAAESLASWFDDDGRYRLRGELDADHGRIVDAALSEARDALFHAGQGKVSWADALVEIAHRSLDAASEGRRERFRVNWFIDPTDPIPARFSDGLAVPHWLRDQLLCDGSVTPVFTDGGLPVSVGRTQSQVPDRIRRLVLQRDRKCRVPWSRRPAGCRSITSSTTSTTAPPTPGTWPGSARPATGSTITANSASPATPTSPTGSPSPTPTAK